MVKLLKSLVFDNKLTLKINWCNSLLELHNSFRLHPAAPIELVNVLMDSS